MNVDELLSQTWQALISIACSLRTAVFVKNFGYVIDFCVHLLMTAFAAYFGRSGIQEFLLICVSRSTVVSLIFVNTCNATYL